MINLISSLLVVMMLAGGVDYRQARASWSCPNAQQRDTVINDKLYVSVEFVLSVKDFKEHPFFVNAFTSAVAEWAKHLPIRTTFYFDGMVVVGQPVPVDRTGSIEVRFVDLQAQPYKYADKIIGIWLPSRRDVLFDLDYFQEHPGELYSVALHELGHVFGLPHVVNKHELGFTGYLVLQDGDARDYVMYPTSFSDRPQNILSEAEIAFAQHQAMFIFSLDSLMRQSECQIPVDKSEKR